MGIKLIVAYSCNDTYIPQTGISLISLFENNKDVDEIIIYFISKGVSDNNKKILQEICDKYSRKLSIFEFDDIAYDLKLTSTGRHIETVYTKIFFSRIPNLDKIIYIDSDTIVNGSLKDLWGMDLTDKYMGMVETYTGDEAKKTLAMPKGTPFYNDGFAIVNVDYCREHNLIGKCLKVIDDFNGNPPVLSEGVLNKVCIGHILSVSPRYNMMAGIYQIIRLNPRYVAEKLNYSFEDIFDSYKRPIIIHYLSGFYGRPWNKGCTHPLRDIFLHYKSISSWKDTPLYKGNLPLRLKLLGRLLNIVGPYSFEKIHKFLNKYVHFQR